MKKIRGRLKKNLNARNDVPLISGDSRILYKNPKCSARSVSASSRNGLDNLTQSNLHVKMRKWPAHADEPSNDTTETTSNVTTSFVPPLSLDSFRLRSVCIQQQEQLQNNIAGKNKNWMKESERMAKTIDCISCTVISVHVSTARMELLKKIV